MMHITFTTCMYSANNQTEKQLKLKSKRFSENFFGHSNKNFLTMQYNSFGKIVSYILLQVTIG